MRHGGLLEFIIKGCVEGKNSRERPQMEYVYATNSEGSRVWFIRRNKGKSEGKRMENYYKSISGLNTKERGLILLLLCGLGGENMGRIISR